VDNGPNVFEGPLLYRWRAGRLLGKKKAAGCVLEKQQKKKTVVTEEAEDCGHCGGLKKKKKTKNAVEDVKPGTIEKKPG